MGLIIRPATILSILLFCAFALLLISVLSTPIIKGVPLAEYRQVSFGVFGYCQKRLNTCTSVQLGYSSAIKTLGGSGPSDYNLPLNTRLTLSKLLVVHPIAAAFALILFTLTFAAHFHSPSNSPRYLLLVLLISIATFLVSLLAFLVDILLFLPHLAFGAWLVLAATACIGISFLGLCGMRRRVVSRKARRRRIAEATNTNANVPGAGFKVGPIVPDQATVNSNGVDKLPEFATFDVDKPAGGDDAGERIPLNPRHQSPPPEMGIGMGMGEFGDDSRQAGFNRTPTQSSAGSNDRYRGPRRATTDPRANMPGAPLPHRLPLNNQYSNPALRPLPGPGPGFGPGYGPRGPGPRGPPPPPGFRGPSYGPRQGYDPYAQGPLPRGNGPPFRDDYGLGGPILPRGTSPGPGMVLPRPGPGMGPGMGPGPRRGPPLPPPPPQGYYPDGGPADRGYVLGMAPITAIGGGDEQDRAMQTQLALPLVEAPGHTSDTHSDEESRVDSRNQPSREDFIPEGLAPGPGGRRDGYGAENDGASYGEEGIKRSSFYEDGGQYVPPRSDWRQQQPQSETLAELPASTIDDSDAAPRPARQSTLPSAEEQSQHTLPQPVERTPSAMTGPSRSQPGSAPASRRHSGYYEDVDPRFVTNGAEPIPPARDPQTIPPSLIAGYDERRRPSPGPQQNTGQMMYRPNNNSNSNFNQYSDIGMYGAPPSHSRGPDLNPNFPPQDDSYEDTSDRFGGTEGPGQMLYNQEDRSLGGDAFTSISQRPTNQRYMSQDNERSPGSDTFSSISQRPINPRYLQQENERTRMLLANNPDFELPATGRGGRARGGPGRGGGLAPGSGPRMPGPGVIPPGLGGRDRGPYPSLS